MFLHATTEADQYTTYSRADNRNNCSQQQDGIACRWCRLTIDAQATDPDMGLGVLHAVLVTV